jgi:predicted DNA-binding transcriptional regulator YafY
MRCLAILLRRGTPFTAWEVGKRFGVSARAIKRDIEFMRDRMEWVIDYDNSNRVYRLRTAPSAVL